MAIFWRVLITTLVARKINVICIAPPGDADSAQALEKMGAKVFKFSLDRKGLNPARDMASIMAIFRLLKKERPDILFATTIKPVIYGCMAAHYAGVPGIFATITGLGYAFEADSILKKALNHASVLLYRTALYNANGVFFQNQDDERLFRERHIITSRNKVFRTRGTGVDTQRFAQAPFPPLPPDGEFVFLLTGRLLMAKGLEEYASAAARLKHKYPFAKFRLLGPPEHGPGHVPADMLTRWQEDGSIEYLGECRDVRPYIAASHVAVLPSWREGVPTAIMEAMSMGRPCVVTDVPGCREVVKNGENGWIASPKDAASLADAMEKFLLDPSSIYVMGQKSRQLAVDKFDADKVADGIIRDMQSVFPDRKKWPDPGSDK